MKVIKPLTVGELINELKKFPKDLVVLTPDMEQRKSDYYEVYSVKVIEAVIDKEWGIRWNDFVPFKSGADIKEYVLLDWNQKYR